MRHLEPVRCQLSLDERRGLGGVELLRQGFGQAFEGCGHRAQEPLGQGGRIRLGLEVKHRGLFGQVCQGGGPILQQLADLIQRRPNPRDKAFGPHARCNERRKVCSGARPKVMVVEPLELVEVELGGRLAAMIQAEPLGELRHGENLIVSMAPAQAGQVIQERLGQVAVFFVLHDRHRTVPLGELFAIGPVNHGQVGVIRDLCPQGFQNVDLAGRVVDVIIAANDMADVHVPVVDHHTEVVGRGAIPAGNDEVV